MLRLEVIGNLGREPEMRYLPSGTAVTSFSVASTRTYTKSDEKVKETTWVNVSVFGNLAENCNKYLHKGSKVFVEGRLTPNERGNPRIWETSDGKPACNFEMVAMNVEFLSENKTDNRTDTDEDEFPF